jgi:hypothetical protein
VEGVTPPSTSPEPEDRVVEPNPISLPDTPPEVVVEVVGDLYVRSVTFKSFTEAVLPLRVVGEV